MTPTPFMGYLSTMFWPAEIAVHGTTVSYLPQGDSAQQAAISVLWKDGASDEDVAPGRYSHIDVRNSDLPAPPMEGDFVQLANGKQFLAVRVAALAVGFCVVTLEEAGAVP